jgi:hypothetical protein
VSGTAEREGLSLAPDALDATRLVKEEKVFAGAGSLQVELVWVATGLSIGPTFDRFSGTLT